MVEISLLIDDEYCIEEVWRAYRWRVNLEWIVYQLDFRASRYMNKPRAVRID